MDTRKQTPDILGDLLSGTPAHHNARGKPKITDNTAKAFVVLFSALFLLALSAVADRYYQKTPMHPISAAATVLEGNSLAPVQYRVLAPALVVLMDRYIFHSTSRAEHFVVFGSIFICFAVCGFVFVKSSGSVPLAFIGVLALFASMVFGMLHYIRQEFLEVVFTAGPLYALYHMRNIRAQAGILVACTILGSLNRETFVFSLIGFAGFLVLSRQSGIDKKKLWPIFFICGLLWLGISVSIRFHYGVKPYYCDVWMMPRNIENLVSFLNPRSAWHLGSGLLWAYFASVLLGVRRYGAFILSYSVPLFITSFFIGLMQEPRLFYAVFFLLIASILGNNTGSTSSSTLLTHRQQKTTEHSPAGS